MLDFTYLSPTEYVFGKDTELKVGKLLKANHAKKVLIHYGGGSIKRSGLFDKVIDSLNEENIEYVELGGVVPNPRDTLVYEGIKLCKEENVDFILAVGGGSVIDSSKAIALGSKHNKDFWDLFDHPNHEAPATPVGVVLTIPAAGSEGSNASVITKTDGMFKRVTYSKYIRPKFAIINPELTYTLPSYQTSCGVVDMISHLLERYLTTTKDVILTDRLIEGTMKSIIEAMKVVKEEPTNYEARATICWSGTIAHNGSLSVGRTEDWASHRLEHELSALYDVAHGAGLAVIFPAYMRYTVDVDIERYKRLAVEVMHINPEGKTSRNVALEGIQAFEDFYKSIGMPVTFDEIGAKESDIDYLIGKLNKNVGDIVGTFKGLTMEDAKKVYKLACK